MNLKLSVILAFLFAALIRSEDTSNNTTDATCTDDLQCSTCQCINSTDPVAIGDPITICAHYVTVNQTTGCIVAHRGAFPVQVDTFSAIQINGSQAYFQNYGFVNIVVQAFGTVKSLPLTYLQQSQFYSNKFSIVIQVSGGVVQSIIWDHQCATCSSSDCYKFTLSNGTLIDTICNDQSCLSASDPTCDTQIYVTWVGSDKNGNKLTSAGMRLSRFEQFSISQLLDSKTIPAYVIPTPNNTDTTHTNTTNTTTPTTPTTPTDNGTGSGTGTDTNTGSDPDKNATHPNTTNTTTPTTPTTPTDNGTGSGTGTGSDTNTNHTNTTDPVKNSTTEDTDPGKETTSGGTGSGSSSGSESGKDTPSTETTGSGTSSDNTSGSGSDTSGKTETETETDTKGSTSTSTDDKSESTTETSDHSTVSPIKTV